MRIISHSFNCNFISRTHLLSSRNFCCCMKSKMWRNYAFFHHPQMKWAKKNELFFTYRVYETLLCSKEVREHTPNSGKSFHCSWLNTFKRQWRQTFSVKYFMAWQTSENQSVHGIHLMAWNQKSFISLYYIKIAFLLWIELGEIYSHMKNCTNFKMFRNHFIIIKVQYTSVYHSNNSFHMEMTLKTKNETHAIVHSKLFFVLIAKKMMARAIY